jgi:hypothetical protein
MVQATDSIAQLEAQAETEPEARLVAVIASPPSSPTIIGCKKADIPRGVWANYLFDHHLELFYSQTVALTRTIHGLQMLPAKRELQSSQLLAETIRVRL